MNCPIIQAINGVVETDSSKMMSMVSRHVPGPYLYRKWGCRETLKILKDQIDSGIIKETDYIVSIGYENGDFQIGVTGSPYKSEDNFENAMHRELGEEIGLKIKPRVKNPIAFSKCIIKNTTQIYGVSVKNILPLTKRDVDRFKSNNKNKRCQDDKQRKIGVIVFGDEKSVKNLIVKIKNFYPSNDKAHRIVAFNVLDAMNWLNFILKTFGKFSIYESFPINIQEYYDEKQERYKISRELIDYCKTIGRASNR